MKLLIGFAIMFSTSTFAAPFVSEVAIEEAFIPEKGYDNNDNIEIVLDGKLPNACFELDNTQVLKDQEKKIIEIKQMMKVKDITECLPNHQNHQNIPMWPIQYTKSIEIGNLKAGLYTLKFNQGKKVISKKFIVTTTVSTGIDNYLYAPVSNAFIPELIYATDNVEVILTGILTNTCMNFNGDVEVQKVGNVFIVLPKMSLNNIAQCSSTQIPLQSIVSLGSIKKEGRYLIHIRSTTGRSVNKVFSVKNTPLDHTGTRFYR